MTDSKGKQPTLKLVVTDGIKLDNSALRRQRGYEWALRDHGTNSRTRVAKGTAHKPGEPNLTLLQGRLANSHLRLVTEKPQLELLTFGDDDNSPTDTKTALTAMSPPPAIEMFTDEEVDRLGARTDVAFGLIVKKKLGDTAALGAEIIADPKKEE